jgi:hypothetical protein
MFPEIASMTRMVLPVQPATGGVISEVRITRTDGKRQRWFELACRGQVIVDTNPADLRGVAAAIAS